MISDEAIKRLVELDEALFGVQPQNALAPLFPPFDVSRPNIHDSKAEFRRELDTVQTIISSFDQIFDAITGDEKTESGEQKNMIWRLEAAINKEAFDQRNTRHAVTPTTARDLAVKNVHETGSFMSTLSVMLDAKGFYESVARSRNRILVCRQSPTKLLRTYDRFEVRSPICSNALNKTYVRDGARGRSSLN